MTFTRLGSGIDAHAFVRLQPGWQLQLSSGGCTQKGTEKLKRVMHAAARILTQTKKYDRGLTRILHDELHWLDVSERILFKPCVHVRKWLHGIASKYMMDLCRPVSVIEGRSRLRSAARVQLDVPRPKLSTCGRRALSYAGPSARNSLLNYLKDCSLTLVTIKRLLKTFYFCFQSIRTSSALKMFAC